jgi:hypothetical protein
MHSTIAGLSIRSTPGNHEISDTYFDSFFLKAQKSERYYQQLFVDKNGGSIEVIMSDGSRCDIITQTHAIEVDFAQK